MHIEPNGFGPISDSGGGSDPLGSRAGGCGANRRWKDFVNKRRVA